MKLFLFSLIILLSSFSNGKIEKKDYKYVPNQLIIKFKVSKSPQLNYVQRNFFKIYNASIITQFSSNGAMLVEFPDAVINKNKNGLLGLFQSINAIDMIEYAEPNWILRARTNLSMGPNDPLFDQLHVYNSNQSVNTNIFANEAWNITKGSKKILVAVIDSGVDYNHEDLAKNYWNNPAELGIDSHGIDKSKNGIDDDNNGFIDDWRGWNFVGNNNNPMDDNKHGTHCAGTIGAVGNNGIGITGLNWNSSIVGLKFLDTEGAGSLANGVLAIEYAIKLGVTVMNNSWGGDEYSPTMAAAIQKASKAGILFVVAAGNNGIDNDVNLDYPAAYPFENIISVGAINTEGNLASFSNYGEKSVQLVAPGTNIFSTTPGNSYEQLDGTSMAAPFVTGAIALIKSRFPQLTSKQIKARLLGTAQLNSKLKGYVHNGLLNLVDALTDDHIPPAVPKNLKIIETNISSLNLSLEMDQDLTTSIKKIFFEVRYSKENPIQTQNDWDRSIPLQVEVENRQDQIYISGFPLSSTGYIAIRAVDHFGNESDVSASLPYKLKPASVIYKNDGNTLEGLSTDGTWGIEKITNLGPVLSDSPGTDYGFHKVNILNLPGIKIKNDDFIVSFDSKYDFESGYDFGYLEYSIDDGIQWNELAKLSGSQDWTQFSFSFLRQKIKFTDRLIKFRFRVESDSTTSMNGWLIKNFRIISKDN